MTRFVWSVCLIATFTIFSNVTTAQEMATTPASVEKTAEAVVAVQKVALEKDGNLVGKVYAVVEGEKPPKNAKMTLTVDGVVVDVVEADESGNFAFASVEPGTYQMYGASDGYVGGGAVDVMPYSSAGCSDCNVGLNSYSSDIAYDSYGSAPVESFGSSTCGGGYGAGSCGGGCGGGGGRLRRGLIFAGVGLGIVGIAGGFDGNDDASPTN